MFDDNKRERARVAREILRNDPYEGLKDIIFSEMGRPTRCRPYVKNVQAYKRVINTVEVDD